MQPNSSTNFEIPKYYQNEPKVNGEYSRNNLPKIKGWDIYDMSWWAWIKWNLFNNFVWECWKCNILWLIWSGTYSKRN